MALRWLSITEAAELAQKEFGKQGRDVSRKTVSRWARSGKVRAERRDSRWYVEPHSLERFVAKALSEPIEQDDDDDDAELDERLEDLREFVRERSALFLKRLDDGID